MYLIIHLTKACLLYFYKQYFKIYNKSRHGNVYQRKFRFEIHILEK